MDKLMFIYINARVLRHQKERRKGLPPPPSDSDSSNKRPKTDPPAILPEAPSWLVLDEDTELDVEDEHLPQEQIDVSQHEDPEDTEDELDEVDKEKEPEKISTVIQLLG